MSARTQATGSSRISSTAASSDPAVDAHSPRTMLPVRRVGLSPACVCVNGSVRIECAYFARVELGGWVWSPTNRRFLVHDFARAEAMIAGYAPAPAMRASGIVDLRLPLTDWARHLGSAHRASTSRIACRAISPRWRIASAKSASAISWSTGTPNASWTARRMSASDEEHEHKEAARVVIPKQLLTGEIGERPEVDRNKNAAGRQHEAQPKAHLPAQEDVD